MFSPYKESFNLAPSIFLENTIRSLYIQRYKTFNLTRKISYNVTIFRLSQANMINFMFCVIGLFQPQKIRNDKGQKDVYVDGGVLCNYPLHAFDGKFTNLTLQYAILLKSLCDKYNR
jgi:hypothetical protein